MISISDAKSQPSNTTVKEIPSNIQRPFYVFGYFNHLNFKAFLKKKGSND